VQKRTSGWCASGGTGWAAAGTPPPGAKATARDRAIGASAGKGRLVRSADTYALSAAVREDGLERGLETLFVESERVARFGFTASELDREKRELLRFVERTHTERERRDSAAFVREYIDHFLEGEPTPGIEYEFELFKRFVPGITLEEVNRLARAWMGEDDRIVMVSAPEKEGLRVPAETDLRAALARATRTEIAPYVDTVSERPLVAEPPADGRITDSSTVEGVGLTVWRLSNGARVVIKPTDFKEDEVLFQAFSPGGSSLASDEDYIPAATASMVVGAGGIGEFNPIDLQKLLAGKVAVVRPWIGSLEEGLNGSASPRDLETLFQLIHLSFTAPRADATIFGVLQQQLRASLSNQRASPGFAFQETLQTAVTQGHRRAWPMTVETVDQLDLERSLAFYKDRFGDAGDFTFVFVGNVTPEILRPLVTRYVASLPSKDRQERWRDEGIRFPEGVVRKAVRKGLEPKSQTAILFSGGFEYDRAHRNAIRALALVMETRLREKLREELGGTYGVSVSESTSWAPRAEYRLSIEFGSAPDRAEELTRVIFDEVTRIKRELPTESEVGNAREAFLRDFETGLTQNRFWLAQLAARYRQDLDPRELLDYPASLPLITPDVVQQAARQYFDTERYVQVTLLPEEGGPHSGSRPPSSSTASRTYRSTARSSSAMGTCSSAVCATRTSPGPTSRVRPHAVRNGTSVVNGNTAVSNPGTVIRVTGGTSRISSTSTAGSSARSAARRASTSPAVRKFTSAVAAGGITLGATPPSTSPTV